MSANSTQLPDPPSACAGSLDAISKELFALLIKGNRQRFVERVVETWKPEAIQSFMRSRGICDTHAELAEVDFYRVLEEADYRRDGHLHIGAWVHKVANNVRLNTYRACFRQCMSRDPDSVEGLGAQPRFAPTREDGETCAIARLDAAQQLWEFYAIEADRITAQLRRQLVMSARETLDQALAEGRQPVHAVDEASGTVERTWAMHENVEDDILPKSLIHQLRRFSEVGATPCGTAAPFEVGRRSNRRDLLLWLAKWEGWRTWTILEISPGFDSPNSVNSRWREWCARFREFTRRQRSV